MQLIDELRYEAYFLTVWDLVRFAPRTRYFCARDVDQAPTPPSVTVFGVTSVDPGDKRPAV